MKRKSGIILSAILVLCMLAGCKRTSAGKTPTVTATPAPTVTAAPQLTGDVPFTVAPSQTKELPIYTISGDFAELTAVTALIAEEEEIDEKVVADAVVDALADSAVYVKVNYVTKNDTVVIVDFDASAPPVTQVGASIEGLILDAFGQSILDNITDCNGVGFSVDGEAYASGHFAFEKGAVYMRR